MYVIYPCVRLISDEFYLCSVTSLFEEIVIISTQVVVICHWGYCSVSVVISEVKSLSRVRLFETPWTVAYQAPPSMGFSRQVCWSGVPVD